MAQVCQKSEKIEKYPREKSYNGFCNRGKTIFSLALGIIKSVCKRFGVILSSGLKIPDFCRKSSLFQISEKNQISALEKNIFLAMKTFCLGTSAVQPLYLEASREPTICVSRLFSGVGGLKPILESKIHIFSKNSAQNVLFLAQIS